MLDDQTRYFILHAYLKKIKYNYPEDSIYRKNHDIYVKELIDENYLEIKDGELVVAEKGKLFMDRRNGIR